MCGSGMKAMMLAHDAIKAGSARVVVAGGFESMSNAPYLLPKARKGLRMGHAQIQDHMFLDGLEDAYDTGKLMGHFAELTATKFNLSRQAQDAFAINSLERAMQAASSGAFDKEIEAIDIQTRDGSRRISQDEQPPKANLERIPKLKAAFSQDGTVTAANSSSISDGAAALVLMRESDAQRRGLSPRARILAHSTFAHEPQWFTTAPVHCIEKLLTGLGMSVDEVDLYEVNEAFAVVTMVTMQELGLEHEKVNVHGGACALGHPIGASGARIVVTLMNALETLQLDTGVASLCIGGGEATAVAIERVTH
jgi:acetyl-CoA C-acetyltransferase